jgi:formylglycine-generating enzyme required for sulfatase activity
MQKLRKYPWLALAVSLAVVLVSLAIYLRLLRKGPAPLPRLTNSLGMEFVQVPAGKFLMGSPANEKGREDDEEQHEVEITRPFYLATTEVTQEQYEKVMGVNPSVLPPAAGTAGRGGYPVENVSWDEAREFCERLSELPEEKKAARRYRLPTEAEWEYACRAGSSTAFAFGNTLRPEQANIRSRDLVGDASRDPHPQQVKSHDPNDWGLYALHGGVREWCSDWYDKDYYKKSPGQDPAGPERGEFRVARGGSWADDALGCRSARRLGLAPGIRLGMGFRVVLVQVEGASH